MTAIRDVFWRLAEHLRGVLDAHETTSTILGLVALRCVAPEELTRVGVSHDFGEALDEAVRRVAAKDAALGEAVLDLLKPLRRARVTLHVVLDALAPLDDLSSKEDIVEGLAGVLASTMAAGPGGVTAPGLLRLLAKLTVERPGLSVCDPFCTSGLVLAMAAASNDRTPSSILGWTRNPHSAAIARATMAAIRAPATIEIGNALVASPSDQTFDAVITAPPFNAPAPSELHVEGAARFRFGMTARHADWLFAQHALSILTDDGIASIVMGRGPLFRSGSEMDIRRRLVEADVVDAVIGLPPGLITGTAIASAIVVLRRRRAPTRRGVVQFVALEGKRTSDLDSQVVDALVRAYGGGSVVAEPVRARGVSLAEIAAAEYSLDPARHLPPIVEEHVRSVSEVLAELRAAESRRAAASSRLDQAFRELLGLERR